MTNKNQQKLIIVAITAIIALSLTLRLFTNLPNFAPFGALALFAGAYISNRKIAFILPFAGLFISDLVLEFNRAGTGFYPDMVFTYVAYMLTIILGFGLRSNRNALKIGGFSIAASLLFFAISNFGVWAATNMYTKTFSGLVTSYEMAIPFFKSTLISDVAFSAIFFGAAYLYQARLKTNAVKA